PVQPPVVSPPPLLEPSPDTMTQAEILFWQSVQQNSTLAGYEEHLKQFPQAQFAGLARLRIAGLRAPPLSPTPVPSKPAPREVSHTASLCGRVTDYSIATPAGGPFDRLVGAWS